MSSNLNEFRRLLQKQAQRAMEATFKDTQAAIGRHVFEKVILRTPVLTGHARHNWRPSINEQVDERQDGVFGGTTTGEPITAEERSRWKAVHKQLQAMPLGQTLWISNNVPYILRLESGTWSAKAPQGMVEITLREVLEGVYKQQPKVMDDDSGG
jgi:alpha-glucuronidase